MWLLFRFLELGHFWFLRITLATYSSKRVLNRYYLTSKWHKETQAFCSSCKWRKFCKLWITIASLSLVSIWLLVMFLLSRLHVVFTSFLKLMLPLHHCPENGKLKQLTCSRISHCSEVWDYRYTKSYVLLVVEKKASPPQTSVDLLSMENVSY